MVVRFLTGPTVMAASSISVGLRGLFAIVLVMEQSFSCQLFSCLLVAKSRINSVLVNLTSLSSLFLICFF